MIMKNEPKIFLGDAKGNKCEIIFFHLINHLDLL